MMRRLLTFVFPALMAFGCGSTERSSSVAAPPEPAPPVLHVEEGRASYYARQLHGRRTASGERFDNDALVAAHPQYPFGTRVRVSNLQNGRSVEVEIVDRGPVRSARRHGVVIDLSRRAAQTLRLIQHGHARVRLEVLRWGPTPHRIAP